VSNASVGAYTIVPSGAQGTGLTNYTIGYSNGTLTVGAASLQITAASTNKVYGATLNPTEYSVTGLLSGDSVTNLTLASAGSVSNATVGSYPISASGASGVGLANYTIGYNSGTLTVGAASLQITAGDTNKVYGATLNPTAYSVAGLLNGDTVTNLTLASSGSVSNAAVGGYAISASGASGVGLANYTIGYNSGTLTVGAASLQITAGDTNKVYGTTLNPVAYSVTGLLNGDSVTNVTLTSPGSAGTATVGGYAINASGASGVGLANYTVGYTSGTLTVSAASLLVTAVDTNKVYGATLNPAVYTVAGLVNGDSVTNVTLVSTGSVGTAAVGSYAINASGALGVGLTNYAIGYADGTLTVGAANLIITAENTNKVYGATLNPTGYGIAGLLNGDTVTNVTLASAGSVSNAPVGSYTITGSGASGAGLTNYTIGYSNGTLTVSAASLLITAGSTNKVYGGTLNPTVFVAAGLVNGDSVTSVTLASAGSVSNAVVGSYAISAADAAGTGLTNYSITYSNGVLLVTPAVLTAQAHDKTRAYGQPNPDLTISYSGFVNGEGTNVLTTLPSASTVATTSSAPGGYTITVTGGSDENYTVNTVHGTLTITGPGSTTIATVEFVGGGNVRVAGTGDANVNYKVEASVDLKTWTLLGTAPSNETGTFEYIDTTTAGVPMRYYRVATP